MKASTVRDVAGIVRDRRKALGWTQAALASKLGVGREWVIQFEKSKPTAEWGTVIRAFQELGLLMDLAVNDQKHHRRGNDALDQILAAATRKQKLS